MSIREDLWEKLVDKTIELGRQITFSEARQWYLEGSFPNPNDYSYYWSEFNRAAARATWELSDENETNVPSKPIKEVVYSMSKKIKPLNDDRKEFVLGELTDIYIRKNCVMPTARDIKNNKLIREDEVDTLRRTHEYDETIIRKRAKALGIEIPNMKHWVKKDEKPEVKNMDSEKRGEIMEEKDSKEKIMEIKAKRIKCTRLTKEECTELLRNACMEAGYILTQAEVNAASAAGELPYWNTLQEKVGPWYLWADMFSLNFKSKTVERIAKQMACAANGDSKNTVVVDKKGPDDSDVMLDEASDNVAEMPVPVVEIEDSETMASDDSKETEPEVLNPDLTKLLAMIASMKPQNGVKIQGSITITFEI